MHWILQILLILACAFVITFVICFLIALKKVKTGKLQREAKKLHSGTVQSVSLNDNKKHEK